MSFCLQFSLTDLKDLNTFLESRSYVVGFSATATDVALFEALGNAPDAQKYPNVYRFYQHIASLTADQRKALPAGVATSSGGAVAAAAADDDSDDDLDLFGDDGDDIAAKVTVAKPVAAAPKKKEKKKKVEKTICVYEVKPYDAETDPAEIEAAIRSIQMDGLVWAEKFHREPIGFGIVKILASVVVEDDKVSFYDLEDAMLAFDEIIQSVDQLSMNKLG